MGESWPKDQTFIGYMRECAHAVPVFRAMLDDPETVALLESGDIQFMWQLGEVTQKFAKKHGIRV